MYFPAHVTSLMMSLMMSYDITDDVISHVMKNKMAASLLSLAFIVANSMNFPMFFILDCYQNLMAS